MKQLTLNLEELKIIEAWAEFCIDTGEDFEAEENNVYQKIVDARVEVETAANREKKANV